MVHKIGLTSTTKEINLPDFSVDGNIVNAVLKLVIYADDITQFCPLGSQTRGQGEKPVLVSQNDHERLLKKKHSSHPLTGRRNTCFNLPKKVQNRPDSGEDSKSYAADVRDYLEVPTDRLL